jgi:hypothetical protein
MEEFVWWMHNRESEHVFQWAIHNGYANGRDSNNQVDETIQLTFDKDDVIRF